MLMAALGFPLWERNIWSVSGKAEINTSRIISNLTDGIHVSSVNHLCADTFLHDHMVVANLEPLVSLVSPVCFVLTWLIELGNIGKVQPFFQPSSILYLHLYRPDLCACSETASKNISTLAANAHTRLLDFSCVQSVHMYTHLSGI